jgi:hypothetical protein
LTQVILTQDQQVTSSVGTPNNISTIELLQESPQLTGPPTINTISPTSKRKRPRKDPTITSKKGINNNNSILEEDSMDSNKKDLTTPTTTPTTATTTLVPKNKKNTTISKDGKQVKTYSKKPGSSREPGKVNTTGSLVVMGSPKEVVVVPKRKLNPNLLQVVGLFHHRQGKRKSGSSSSSSSKSA